MSEIDWKEYELSSALANARREPGLTIIEVANIIHNEMKGDTPALIQELKTNVKTAGK